MGCYFETKSPKYKAQYLVDNHDGKIMLKPELLKGERIAICVVDNGPFEAALIICDEIEFRRALNPQGRETIWLSIPKEDVLKNCPEVKKHLDDD